MGKKILAFVCAALIIAFFYAAVPKEISADMGPKPSVVIDFENMNGETYYVTLLSSQKSTGPYIAHEGGDEENTDDIWRAFAHYKDKDGYYFLQFCKELHGDDTFKWTYYPPDKFKVLLYFPERKAYVADDGIYERYAFDSYYTFDGGAIDFENGRSDAVLVRNSVEKSYNYPWETFSLIVRYFITVAIEVALALIFGFKRKGIWVLRVLAVNAVTQLFLKVALNLEAHYLRTQYVIVVYAMLETAVAIAECTVYAGLNGISRTVADKDGIRRILAYGAVANILSFGAGLGLAKVIPGIF